MGENNECKCNCNGEDPKLKEILEQYVQDKSNLIQILNDVQNYYGYIPEKAQKAISEYLNVPMAEVYGVITFYSRFTLKPKGKNHIAICLGTACFVKGSERILDRAKERLHIDVGETSKDGKYSLEATRCIGACGIAAVFTVNGEVYGKATVKMFDEVLDNIEKENN